MMFTLSNVGKLQALEVKLFRKVFVIIFFSGQFLCLNLKFFLLFHLY